jgi:hypothetical protein
MRLVDISMKSTRARYELAKLITVVLFSRQNLLGGFSKLLISAELPKGTLLVPELVSRKYFIYNPHESLGFGGSLPDEFFEALDVEPLNSVFEGREAQIFSGAFRNRITPFIFYFFLLM